MHKTLTTLALAAITTAAAASQAHGLSITAMDSAENLAQSLVGSGITISNVQYNGVASASGYFNNGSESGLGLESGIVLTTGSAASLHGASNSADDTTTANFLSGDANLNSLINDGAYPSFTYDATVLEFDFVSSGDAAYFNYVFGSEEYIEYVDDGFNDVFGFFLDGTNLAVVPGTGTAVSVDNVNDQTNSFYFNDNDPCANGYSFAECGTDGSNSPFAFEYDGFTDVFTATANGLTAGQTYHLILAIADVGDYALDSGVFLEAGSFSNSFSDRDTAPVPEPATIFLFGTGLSSLGFFGRKSRKSSQATA